MQCNFSNIKTNFFFQVSFDLSLARGLDYYTGVIYEAILTGEQPDLGKTEKVIKLKQGMWNFKRQ